MDACTARPSSDCTDFASDTTTISLDCLIHLCAPACYGNYTTPPILQSIHYHATPGTTGSGTNVVTEGVIPELRNGVVNRQQLQTRFVNWSWDGMIIHMSYAWSLDVIECLFP